MRQLRGVSLVLGAAALLCGMTAVAAPTQVSHGRFENVPVVKPDKTPTRVVIWFRGGANDVAHAARIEALCTDGAMVIDVDVTHLKNVLKHEGSCAFSDGDVENFSRYVQAYFHVPTYHLPILGGDGAGAELAYAVAAGADTGIFAGLLTDGFCAHTGRQQTVCGDGVKDGRLHPTELQFPWLAAADPAHSKCPAGSNAAFFKDVPEARVFNRSKKGDALPGIVAAARVMGAQKGVSLPPAPVDLTGIPVVEMPGKGAGAGDGHTFAIFVSGDGGWAGLDQETATALTESGIPVVGVDSLRYFWTARDPKGFAADLERVIHHYSQQWQRDRVVLIGFSQGADVLPAAINQLSADSRQHVALSVLLSPGTTADYEFHVSNWLGSSDRGLPIAPEVERMSAATTLCVYGVDDDDALCPKLPAGAAQVVKLPGDHHFEGDYATLAKTILGRIPAH